MKHDDPAHRSPPRAEPLHPDRPTQGMKKQSDRDGQAPAKGQQADLTDSAKKRRRQSEDALDNVREGYGGD